MKEHLIAGAATVIALIGTVTVFVDPALASTVFALLLICGFHAAVYGITLALVLDT